MLLPEDTNIVVHDVQTVLRVCGSGARPKTVSKPVNLGHHPDRRGNGTEHGDGGGVGGGVHSGKGVLSPQTLGTKPNDVRGGLRGRIQMWEMKSQTTRDEKCTLYNTAMNQRPKLSDRQEMDRS